ncbi:Thioredoxin domain-containing protein 5 [Entophlyctis sp. JEL0112]|nr:Thioredoxin domain-containing protein 5 [Entophlyctis sp. JEL0112]
MLAVLCHEPDDVGIIQPREVTEEPMPLYPASHLTGIDSADGWMNGFSTKMPRLLLLLALLLTLCAAAANAKLTDEEKRILRESADEADKHIRQVSPADFDAAIAKGYHLIFFGAVWCRVTQRFSPKDAFDQRGWNDVPDFSIAKVQCAYENEHWCVTAQNLHAGYPAIMLYHNGAFVEEYMHRNDVDPVIHFLEHVYDLVKEEHATNSAHADVIAAVDEKLEKAKQTLSNGEPAGPVTTRPPVHHKIGQIDHLDEDMMDIDLVDEETYQKELKNHILEYNDELNVMRISSIVALLIAVSLVGIFCWSRARILPKRMQKYEHVKPSEE